MRGSSDHERVWVIIPAYNEEKHIGKVVEKVKSSYSNVIVANDGSKDTTKAIAEQKGAEVVSHAINLGKGAALKTGCDYALKKGATTLVFMDADGQHKPEDIPRFVEALEKVDIVFGYRQLNKNMPAIMRFGNWFINTLASFLYGVRIKDTQSGFRAVKAETYKKVRWDATDYSMEMEMIARVGKHHLTYTEIPIETIYLDKYKGTTVFDGMKIVINMLIWKMRGK